MSVNKVPSLVTPVPMYVPVYIYAYIT